MTSPPEIIALFRHTTTALPANAGQKNTIQPSGLAATPSSSRNADHEFTDRATSHETFPTIPSARSSSRHSNNMPGSSRKVMESEERRLLGGANLSNKARPATIIPSGAMLQPAQNGFKPMDNLYNPTKNDLYRDHRRASNSSLSSLGVRKHRDLTSHQSGNGQFKDKGKDYPVAASFDPSQEPLSKRQKRSSNATHAEKRSLRDYDAKAPYPLMIEEEDDVLMNRSKKRKTSNPIRPLRRDGSDGMELTADPISSSPDSFRENAIVFEKPKIQRIQGERSERLASTPGPIQVSDDEVEQGSTKVRRSAYKVLENYLNDDNKLSAKRGIHHRNRRRGNMKSDPEHSLATFSISDDEITKEKPVLGQKLEDAEDSPVLTVPSFARKAKGHRQDVATDSSPDELQQDDNSKLVSYLAKANSPPVNIYESEIEYSRSPSPFVRPENRGDIPRSRFNKGDRHNANSSGRQESTKQTPGFRWNISYFNGITPSNSGSDGWLSFLPQNRSFSVETPPERAVSIIEARKLNIAEVASENGLEVRLRGGRMMDRDQIWDLRFCARNDLQKFLKCLRDSTPIKELSKTSNHLSLAFEKRTQEETRNERNKRTESYGDMRVSQRNSVLRDSGSQNLLLWQRNGKRSKLMNNLQSTQASIPLENSEQGKEIMPQPRKPVVRGFLDIARTTRSSERVAARNSITNQRKFMEPEEHDPVTDLAVHESYVESLGEKWAYPLIYPKTGMRRATIDYEDLYRLKDGEFLNDNVITFYLRYLEERAISRGTIPAKSVHFFNSYFYDTLTKTERRQRVNYNLVKKWVKDDIFKYNYAVVPINEDAHCTSPNVAESPDEEQHKAAEFDDEMEVLVGDQVRSINIGNGSAPLADQSKTQSVGKLSLEDHLESSILSPTEVERDKDDQDWPDDNENRKELLSSPFASSTRDSPARGSSLVSGLSTPAKPIAKKGLKKKLPPKPRRYNLDEPIIIILDSLDLAHPQTRSNLKAYLTEEAQAKLGIDVLVEHAVTAKGIPLQPNYYDCGVYLLAYIDKFLTSPKHFVSKILTREMDNVIDWPEMNVTNMRVSIKDLILELHKTQEAERTPKKKKGSRNKRTLQHATEKKPQSPERNRGSSNVKQKSELEGQKEAEGSGVRMQFLDTAESKVESSDAHIRKAQHEDLVVPNSTISRFFETTRAALPLDEAVENSREQDLGVAEYKTTKSTPVPEDGGKTEEAVYHVRNNEEEVVEIADSQSPSRRPIRGPSNADFMAQLTDAAHREKL